MSYEEDPLLSVPVSIHTVSPAVNHALPPATEPYFLGLNRAMVSLGPLATKTYCTFKCPFCYVNGPYRRYANRSIDDVLEWLTTHRASYDVVYVSGDTDSFAPPRTAAGLELLSRLLELDVDVLLTTRHVFDRAEQKSFEEMLANYDQAGRLLVPCVSICQLSHGELEPKPVPTPAERTSQLKWLSGIGAPSVLTIRPFIPYIDEQEYVDVVEAAGSYCDVILGGDWFVDPAGVIDSRTRNALGVPDSRRLEPTTRGELDSSIDREGWLVYAHPAAEKFVAEAAVQIGRPFFMRSAPAVDHLRQARDKTKT